MDNINNFVKASEHKIKIYNIINNKNLPYNFYVIENTDNSLIHQLRTLIIELLIHPEWYIFFGNLQEVLKKNSNTFTILSVNEILQQL